MATVGLIAGSGRFPILVAQEARRMNVDIVALGIRGVTDASLEPLVSRLDYFKLGQLDAPIKALKSAGVTRAVMAGKVQHASLFGGVLPDFRAIKVFARLKDKRTDTILKAVADEFSLEGIELISSAAYLSHLLAGEGRLSRRGSDAEEKANMRLGWRAAKAVAGQDIGQTVVVSENAVVAVEAMEGTDACILRAADIAASHGGKPRLTVVKVAKPGQDLRFDIPVMGLDSLSVFAKARVSAVALEAGTTLLFDKEKFMQEADAAKICVMGFAPEGPAS
ncbi:MAG TPA: UDP-2,3-diacylglucosamine diphosphatase LpxI [Elusimicrobiota bacterium]|nr:UDP-2,3-diacylglucosamine diphosphatase LpxI [Elusimicrobiota bacterium]